MLAPRSATAVPAIAAAPVVATIAAASVTALVVRLLLRRRAGLLSSGAVGAAPATAGRAIDRGSPWGVHCGRVGWTLAVGVRLGRLVGLRAVEWALAPAATMWASAFVHATIWEWWCWARHPLSMRDARVRCV
jgi:hypothetical protein